MRYNPLRGEWVLVSPHRLRRPWQGQVGWRAWAPHPRVQRRRLAPGSSGLKLEREEHASHCAHSLVTMTFMSAGGEDRGR